MGNATYLEKLKDPRWQKKRLEILQRDEFTCQWCFDADSTLHVHHLWYSKGEPWGAEEESLITLCESCHEAEGENRKKDESLLISACQETRLGSASICNLALAIRESQIKGETAWDAMCWGIDNVEMRGEIYAKYMAYLDSRKKINV